MGFIPYVRPANSMLVESRKHLSIGAWIKMLSLIVNIRGDSCENITDLAAVDSIEKTDSERDQFPFEIVGIVLF
jgi:NAD-dependent DNA ligase